MLVIYTKSFQIKRCVFGKMLTFSSVFPPNLAFVQMATFKRWTRSGGTDAGFTTQTVVPFEIIETTLRLRKMIGALYSSAIAVSVETLDAG